jgi:hypothetical protein
VSRFELPDRLMYVCSSPNGSDERLDVLFAKTEPNPIRTARPQPSASIAWERLDSSQCSLISPTRPMSAATATGVSDGIPMEINEPAIEEAAGGPSF